MWWTCNGGDAAGVTAGGACTVAVVDGVVIAGATAGAIGTAAGNLDLLHLGGEPDGLCPLWVISRYAVQQVTSARPSIATAKADMPQR
jgi:hypothetical protein